MGEGVSIDLRAIVLEREMRDDTLKRAAAVILRWAMQTQTELPEEVRRARDVLRTGRNLEVAVVTMRPPSWA